MKLDIKSLNYWQQQIFAASLVQRMLPNYQYFSVAAGYGNYSVLTNQMDIIWQKLALMPVKFNSDAQLDKLMEVTPNAQEFDIFAVYPALDACSGLDCLFESFNDKDCHFLREISELSISTVKSYLEFVSSQQTDNEITASSLNDEPLLIWEIEMQQALFEFALTATMGKKDCQKIKTMSMAEKLTNLAIEY